MSVKVTFAYQRDIEYVAWALGSKENAPAEIGAQYEAVGKDGTPIVAVFWEHEDPWSLIDRMPFTNTLTVDFAQALPTLSEVFGLNIPCVTN